MDKRKQPAGKMKKYIIAVDLGGTNLKIGLLNLQFKIKKKKILDTQNLGNKKNLILAIINSVKDLISKNRLKKENILGIGVGLPGPIDNQKGIVHFLPNIAGWREVRLGSILNRKLRMKVFLDNDVNLMALAENKLGAAKKYKNVVCLTLGTGVGGGIIINNSLYRGSDNASGEIGHIPLNEVGPACSCGGEACLERYVGNSIIMEEAKRLFKRDISLKELSRLAKENNRKALYLWDKVAWHLAIALAGVANLLNPDCVVIGGGVAGAGRILFDNVRKYIFERAMKIQSRRVKVVKADLGNNAGLIGAAILVKESIS
ncbi:MAG: hypothetical protein DRP74_04075 [Candidatus Omnitrophota bacterium]|nr:MAG: hypothetical protein DRP74_04075 [Candidatus Omnitrophota bacterium]